MTGGRVVWASEMGGELTGAEKDGTNAPAFGLNAGCACCSPANTHNVV